MLEMFSRKLRVCCNGVKIKFLNSKKNTIRRNANVNIYLYILKEIEHKQNLHILGQFKKHQKHEIIVTSLL